MVAGRFPLWTNLVEYWDVDDVDLRDAGRGAARVGAQRAQAGGPTGESTSATGGVKKWFYSAGCSKPRELRHC